MLVVEELDRKVCSLFYDLHILLNISKFGKELGGPMHFILQDQYVVSTLQKIHFGYKIIHILLLNN